MFKNYLKTTFRNISRDKLTSFIKIFSLTLGLACTAVITLIVLYEQSFDSFHQNNDRIYRVYIEINRPQGIVEFAPVQFPLPKAAGEKVPGIENAVQFTEFTSLIAYNDKKFYENSIYTTPDVFSTFSFPLKQGNPDKVLSEPYSVVISEDAAEKYF